MRLQFGTAETNQILARKKHGLHDEPMFSESPVQFNLSYKGAGNNMIFKTFASWAREAFLLAFRSHNRSSHRSRRRCTPQDTHFREIQLLESRVMLSAASKIPLFQPVEVFQSGQSQFGAQVSWTDLKHEKGYRLEQYNGTDFQTVAVVGKNVAQYSLSGLDPDTYYYLTVAPTNKNGLKFADSISFKTPTIQRATLPQAPTGLTAVATSSSAINLTWPNVVGNTGYQIYESISGVPQFIGSVGTDIAFYNVTGLAPETTYTFYIGTLSSAGNSALTPVVAMTQTAAPVVIAPSATNFLFGSPSSGTTVNLNWTDVANETGYRIYSWDGTNSHLIGSTAANVTSFSATGLPPASTDSFSIESYNSAGSAMSSIISVNMLPFAVPLAPANLNANVLSSTTVNLTWNDVANETGYRIYSWNGPSSQLIGSTSANVNSFTVTGLTPTSSTSFSVEAYNSAGVAMSGIIWVNLQVSATAPSNPANFHVTSVSSNAVSLSWGDVSNETGYRLSVSNGVSIQVVGTPGANVTTYTVTGLAPSTTYNFFLTANNAAGDSGVVGTSATTSAATTQPGVPTAPGGLAAVSVSGTTVSLNWNDVANENGYRIKEWTGNTWQLIGSFAANVTSCTVTGLSPVTTYLFQIEAYNAFGSNVSNQVSVMTSSGDAEGLVLRKDYQGQLTDLISTFSGSHRTVQPNGSANNIWLSDIVQTQEDAEGNNVRGRLIIQDFGGFPIDVPFVGLFDPDGSCQLIIHNTTYAGGSEAIGGIYFSMNFIMHPDGSLTAKESSDSSSGFTINDSNHENDDYGALGSPIPFIKMIPNPTGIVS